MYMMVYGMVEKVSFSRASGVVPDIEEFLVVVMSKIIAGQSRF